MINIKKIKPMFSGLITTMDKYEEYTVTKGGIIDASKQVGALKEYQTVVAVGPIVRDVVVGDIIWINPKRFARLKHKPGGLKDGVIQDNPVESYEFDIVKMDGKDYLLLQNGDIDFVIEEYEEVEDAPPSPIIQPAKPSIIIS